MSLLISGAVYAHHYNYYNVKSYITVNLLYGTMKKGIYKLKILYYRFNIRNISFECYNDRYSYHPVEGMLVFFGFVSVVLLCRYTTIS